VAGLCSPGEAQAERGRRVLQELTAAVSSWMQQLIRVSTSALDDHDMAYDARAQDNLNLVSSSVI
jgi:hypothetical protein